VGRVDSWPAVALAALVALGCGCAGYRLGPSNDLAAGAESIFVEPFRNETLQPRLEDEVTREVRKGLVREGTFRLGNRRDCDLVLRGTITGYSRQGLSYDPTDAQTPTDYSVTILARVTVSRRESGEVLWERAVSGSSQVRAQGDLQSAERQAMPLVAANLARQVVDMATDGDW
jgi:hypothetical protein